MPHTQVLLNDKKADNCPVPVPTSIIEALEGILLSSIFANGYAEKLRSSFVENKSKL